MATRLVIALLILLFGFTAGWRVQAWRYAANAAESAEQARELAVQRRRGADAAAATYEAERQRQAAQQKVITREVERVVERPVYRNVCLDADGLRILGAAVDAARPAAGEPAPAMPGPDGAR